VTARVSTLRAAGSMLAVALVLAALLACGRGPLGAPPLTAPEAWRAWLAARTADQAFLALMRLLALGLGGYVLAAALARGGAGAVGTVRLVALIDALTLPALRPIVQAMAGAAIAASTVTVASAASAVTVTPDTVTLTRLPDVGAHGPAARPATTTTTTTPVATPPSRPTPAPLRAAVWEVRETDSMWSIAARVVSLGRRRDARPDEIAGYWSALIAANRDRLRYPADADLIYPGQVFELPDINSAARPPRSPAAGPQE
jgi:hypothetical protein